MAVDAKESWSTGAVEGGMSFRTRVEEVGWCSLVDRAVRRSHREDAEEFDVAWPEVLRRIGEGSLMQGELLERCKVLADVADVLDSRLTLKAGGGGRPAVDDVSIVDGGNVVQARRGRVRCGDEDADGDNDSR